MLCCHLKQETMEMDYLELQLGVDSVHLILGILPVLIISNIH